MQFEKRLSTGLDVISAVRDNAPVKFVTARRQGDDNLEVFRTFPAVDTIPLLQFAFGGRQFCGDAVELMGTADWPLIWIHGDGCSGENVSGTQAYALAPHDVRRLTLDGAVVGTIFEDDDAEYCYLGGVLPEDKSASRMDQARSVFERIEALVGQAGMGFSDVIRTWLFLDDLLDWYDDFNVVRTQFFNERGVFDGIVPASTGIGAANPQLAALVSGAIAIRPKHSGTRAFAVPSPLQCPALDYKSSFSRAVEVEFPDHRQLLISGTASIHPDGISAHLGDTDKQIDLTMRVGGAILESRGMGWSDVTRMIAYFKDMREAERLAVYCKQQNIPQLPVVCCHAAVCRDDLLFEIELDAAKAGPSLPN